ncbi:hypothetical protein X802_09430 [Thermococcus guaymasensis DSM 11113]|uniref:Uncharacterized protein n=1 Tax=Thermococcus guaymasensis DSM 11113 TaxID=1432656 RepID=A0A0X1KM43_9EURY|nr:hypothetical protein [Thermococcus guaymasensis]AJC72341.1 hypothetical protein X802_09430 [Thermococcus guaymasensis DSM 11113]
MAGTVSKIVRFEDEEAFVKELDLALEAFSYLASKYGHNPVEGVVLWDQIGIRDEESVKVFRVGEFPFVEGLLNLELEKIRVLESYFDEMESKWDELSVEDIANYVDLMNDTLGEERVYYDAYSLGLDRNTAYLILNIVALTYLEGVLDGEDREIFEGAVELLLKYL